MGTRKNRICIAGGLNILTVKSVEKMVKRLRHCVARTLSSEIRVNDLTREGGIIKVAENKDGAKLTKRHLLSLAFPKPRT